MAELHLERRCFWIYGDVQGVAYRAHAQAKARELGVAGYVQNCADGRVEIYAQGAAPQLEALFQWCRVGPPLADVERVEIFDDPVIERWPQPFEIRR